MRRWVYFILAILVTVGTPRIQLNDDWYLPEIGFFSSIYRYWVPANSGVDQNGYLFGGRQVAQTGTMKFAPRDPATGEFDPHQFVGRMWVGADYTLPSERFYPKYPIGLPVIYAVALKAGGPDWGPWLVYLVNPIAMSLAVFATFLLLRSFCGSFLALVGQVIFATSPVTVLLAIDANSHATAVCCVAWGMVGLIHWWKHGTPWIGAAGGVLLGYAATIRYSEATLVAPVLLVIVFRLLAILKSKRLAAATDGEAGTPSTKRDWISALLVLAGWTLPVLALVVYNRIAMGAWTGYDPTNESKPGASFNFEHFRDNWETMLRHLTSMGLFFVFPIAVMGLVWMFAWHRRAALVLAAWIVPCLLCYTFYYWAPDGTSIGYLRFFLTIFPALVLCAMWLLGDLTELIRTLTPRWTTRFIASLIIPVVALTAIAVQLWNVQRDLQTAQYQRLLLKANADQILAEVEEGSVIFGADHGTYHHLQFMKNYLLYDLNTYREGTIRSLMNNVDPDDPQGLDPGRSKSLYERLKDLKQAELDERQRRTVLASLAQGRNVYVIEPPGGRQRAKLSPVIATLTSSKSPEPLYANVVQRWRHNIVPAFADEPIEEKKKRGAPRQAGIRLKPTRYDQPFLIYQISKTPPAEPSPEIKAVHEAEAAAAKAEADRKAAEAARAEALKQQRDAERQRQEAERNRLTAERQKQETAIREAQQQLTAAQAALAKSTADRAALDKQLADARAQLPKVQEQVSIEQGAIARAAADRQTLEQALARVAASRDQAARDLDTRTKELAALTAKLESQKKELESVEQKLKQARED